MVHEHEVLIHISAPVTRQNDTLYRSLADAYLDFEPGNIIREHASPQRDADADASSPDADTTWMSDPAVLDPGSSFRSDVDISILSTGRDSYGSFPSGVSQTQGSCAPPSSRLARLEQIQRNWKAQVRTTPRSSGASKSRDAEGCDVEEEEEYDDVDTAFIEDTQDAISALQSQMPESFDMTDEDITEDGLDEGHVEFDGDAGIFTQEVSLGDAESTGRMAAAATEEPLQSELESSSPLSWEDSDEGELEAGNVAQEDAPSFDTSDKRIPAGIAEDTVSPLPTPLPREHAAVTGRRKSARLQGSREAEITAPGHAKTRPESESHGLLPGLKRRSSRLNNASKLAAPFKIPTAVTSRRKSPRTEDTGAPAVPSHIPPNPLPVPTRTVTKPQKVSRSHKSPKPAISPPPLLLLHHKPANPDDSIDFSLLPYSVLAPEPAIGTETPPSWPSQITPYLAELKTLHPSLFRPRKQLDTPAPDTRGFWSINCSAWPARSQKCFWDNLVERLGDGRLGWATSLHREIGGEDGGRRGLGVVRVFCWGELVEGMWVVLWECSGGRVSGVGGKWVDAWGRVVVEME